MFSRFRKTVNSVRPKSSLGSGKGGSNSNTAVTVEPNHQRPTKSYAEKTLKPNNSIRSTHSISSNSRNGRASGGSKVLEIDYAPRDGPLLRRSSTFTLEDEEIENTIPEQRYRHRNSSNDDVSLNDEHRHRNADSNTHGRSSRGKLVAMLLLLLFICLPHETKLHYIGRFASRTFRVLRLSLRMCMCVSDCVFVSECCVFADILTWCVWALICNADWICF